MESWVGETLRYPLATPPEYLGFPEMAGQRVSEERLGGTWVCLWGKRERRRLVPERRLPSGALLRHTGKVGDRRAPK